MPGGMETKDQVEEMNEKRGLIFVHLIGAFGQFHLSEATDNGEKGKYTWVAKTVDIMTETIDCNGSDSSDLVKELFNISHKKDQKAFSDNGHF